MEGTPSGIARAADGDLPAPPAISRRRLFLSRWRIIAGVIALGLIGWAAWHANAWRHLQSGKRALALHHHREAQQHFQSVLRVWPNDPATSLLAARAARLNGEFEAADHYLKLCQGVEALSDAAFLERVLLRACRGEIDAVAQYCYAMLDRQHPDSPLILEALALGNLHLLRFGAAEGALERWLEMAPDEPQAIFLRGRLQLQAANNTEAIEYLRRAVELDPDREEARLLLAGLLLDLGQAQEALPHLELVCQRQPGNYSAQARRGQALVLLGRPEEATQVLDDVLAHRPDLSMALLERGKLALREGQLEQAEHWLKQACQRDIGDRAAHYQYLQCLKQMDKTKEARAVQERLDAIDAGTTRMHEIVTVELPERRFDPDLLAELGELMLEVGLDKDGTVWLNRALQIDPRTPRAHRAFAKYYESLGQASLARQHLAIADAADVTEEAPLP